MSSASLSLQVLSSILSERVFLAFCNPSIASSMEIFTPGILRTTASILRFFTNSGLYGTYFVKLS